MIFMFSIDNTWKDQVKLVLIWILLIVFLLLCYGLQSSSGLFQFFSIYLIQVIHLSEALRNVPPITQC